MAAHPEFEGLSFLGTHLPNLEKRRPENSREVERMLLNEVFGKL
jgi:hypothetical protein